MSEFWYFSLWPVPYKPYSVHLVNWFALSGMQCLTTRRRSSGLQPGGSMGSLPLSTWWPSYSGPLSQRPPYPCRGCPCSMTAMWPMAQLGPETSLSPVMRESGSVSVVDWYTLIMVYMEQAIRDVIKKFCDTLVCLFVPMSVYVFKMRWYQNFLLSLIKHTECRPHFHSIYSQSVAAIPHCVRPGVQLCGRDTGEEEVTHDWLPGISHRIPPLWHRRGCDEPLCGQGIPWIPPCEYGENTCLIMMWNFYSGICCSRVSNNACW